MRDSHAIKSNNLLNPWSCKITWQTKIIMSSLWWLSMRVSPIKSHWQAKSIISPLTRFLPTPKLAGWWLNFERLPSLKARDRLITWPRRSDVAISNIYISAFTKLVVTHLDRVLTSEKSFIKQTLKWLPTSCLSLCLKKIYAMKIYIQI